MLSSKSSAQYAVILDIGKTHIKLAVIDQAYKIQDFMQIDNQSIYNDADYLHINIDVIWLWFVKQLKVFSTCYSISAINVSAHGATVALIGHYKSNINDSGLIFPVMDYEWTGIKEINIKYEKMRPPFDATYSPLLSNGLNIGKQITWLEWKFPTKFKQVASILLYPQYWVWRMTGKKITEITSLGCHTDMWDISNSTYSKLVTSRKWDIKMPPLCNTKSFSSRGSEVFIQASGINKDCQIYSGLHDSSAGYIKYIGQEKIIISSGTWVVFFSPNTSLSHLIESRDMLSNIDIFQQSVACARFMGGREYATICQITNSLTDSRVTQQDLQDIIDHKVMALPSFGGNSGPYPDNKGKIIGFPKNGTALAIIYIALIMNVILDLLQVNNDILISGVFSKNLILCQLLAQLRFKHQQTVLSSNNKAGSIVGAASMCFSHTFNTNNNSKETMFQPTTLNNIHEYMQCWNQMI